MADCCVAQPISLSWSWSSSPADPFAKVGNGSFHRAPPAMQWRSLPPFRHCCLHWHRPIPASCSTSLSRDPEEVIVAPTPPLAKPPSTLPTPGFTTADLTAIGWAHPPPQWRQPPPWRLLPRRCRATRKDWQARHPCPLRQSRRPRPTSSQQCCRHTPPLIPVVQLKGSTCPLM